MDLSAYLAVLRRWSLTLLASTLVGGGVAFFAASRIPPTYEGEARVIVGPINTDQNTLDAAGSLAQTYAELVTTETILSPVNQDLGLDLPLAVLRESITARADSTTRILTITVRASSPDTAATMANAVAAVLDELAARGQVRPEGEISVVNAAIPNPVPVEPQVSLIVMLAAASGLISALAVVLFIDYFNNTVSGREDLGNITQAPFLGAIAVTRGFRPTPKEPVVVEARPNSRAALAYRLLGSQVTAGDPDSNIRSLAVLGAEDREGAGEVAANLAAVLTRAGRRVRLVDVNDEEREVTRLFGLQATRRLVELMRDDADLEEMAYRRSGIDVIPQIADPSVIAHDHARRVLDRLKSDVDLVILSTAPIHRSANALLWARTADAAILVARRDKTKRENVAFTVESLRLIGTRLLGTVLHGAPRRGGSSDLPEPESAGARRQPRASRPDDRPTAVRGSDAGREPEPVRSRGASE